MKYFHSCASLVNVLYSHYLSPLMLVSQKWCSRSAPFLAFEKCCSSNKAAHINYANMLMQYFAILNAVKIDNFQMKNMVVILCINFLFLLQVCLTCMNILPNPFPDLF